MSDSRDARHAGKNTMLFYIAAGISIGMAFWFTIAFFRDHLGMHDVSAGWVSIGLGLIAVYAGHNKLVMPKCSGVEKKRPGEWIFAFIIFWASVMWTLYQTKVFSHVWGVDLVVPAQFYAFTIAIIAIFGGSRIWDIFSSYRVKNGKTKSQAEEADNKTQA